MRKELRTNYLFLCVNSKLRLVKLSAVTNIVSFRAMMKDRHPDYEIVNDTYPMQIKVSEDIIHKLMDRLNDCKKTSSNEYRTYDLDHYRIQTVIRLITRGNDVKGQDRLKCVRCGEDFYAVYDNLNDLYQFLNIDVEHCSDECMPNRVTKDHYPTQRYCKCGNVFNPTHRNDFYCQKCLNTVEK